MIKTAATNNIVPATPILATGTAPAVPVGPVASQVRDPVLPPASDRQNNTSGHPARRILRPSGFVTVNLAPSVIVNGTKFPSTQTVSEAGNCFSILQSNMPVQVQPQPAGRNETYYPGSTERFDANFSALIVTNPSTTATLTCKIWIGMDLTNYTAPILPVQQFEVLTLLAAANTPTPVSAVDLWFTQGYFYGYNAFAGGVPVNNSASGIWVGKSKTYQPDPIAAGQVIPYQPSSGRMFNLANIYFQGATIGDGIYFEGVL